VFASCDALMAKQRPTFSRSPCFRTSPCDSMPYHAVEFRHLSPHEHRRRHVRATFWTKRLTAGAGFGAADAMAAVQEALLSTK